MSSAGANDVMASVQRVGHYNDPDMLQVRIHPHDVAAASSTFYRGCCYFFCLLLRLLLLRTNVALDDIHVTHVRVTSRLDNLSNIDAPFASPPFASPPFVFSIPERPGTGG